MSKIRYWLWLSAVNMAPRAKSALLGHFSDVEEIYYAGRDELARVYGLSANDLSALENRDLSRVDEVIRECIRQDITIITLQDAAYPDRLRNIYDPPLVLYVKGKLPPIDELAPIAVIGTRRASAYGLRMARTLAWEITRCGGTVISGLTAGIDAAAARAALDAGGACIGVLGTAHECENGELSRAVSENGALISEYPPGTETMKSFFRARNRITAGLAVGAAVVEAPKKSGALLFASEALEQGKEIFAVPGNADSFTSAGSNGLLKLGAKPVTCGWDVMVEFASLYPQRVRPCNEEPIPPEPEVVSEKPAPAEEKPIPSQPEKPAPQLDKLGPDQRSIVEAVMNGAGHIDEIIEATQLTTSKVLTLLTLLEVKGVLSRRPGQRIEINFAKK